MQLSQGMWLAFFSLSAPKKPGEKIHTNNIMTKAALERHGSQDVRDKKEGGLILIPMHLGKILDEQALAGKEVGAPRSTISVSNNTQTHMHMQTC